MLRGLAAAWAVVFILCMGELGTTQLVIPNGRETLALKIYTLANSGANPDAATLSLVLVTLNFLFAATAVLIVRRRRCLPLFVHNP
jgi:ABC-type Fe3+ transport system permease subunit